MWIINCDLIYLFYLKLLNELIYELIFCLENYKKQNAICVGENSLLERNFFVWSR